MAKRLYSIEGKVIKVVDGDTLHIDLYLFPNLTMDTVKFRLEGINAEELKTKTPRAIKAKEVLTQLVFGREVIVEFTNTKSFDRFVGKVFLKKKNYEIDVCKYMLDTALVDEYTK